MHYIKYNSQKIMQYTDISFGIIHFEQNASMQPIALMLSPTCKP